MYCTANKHENEIIHSVNLTTQNLTVQLFSTMSNQFLAPLGTSVQTLWPCPPKQGANLIFT